MLFLHLFCGVREKRGKEWNTAGKGAKRNLTWGEWVGDQSGWGQNWGGPGPRTVGTEPAEAMGTRATRGQNHP